MPDRAPTASVEAMLRGMQVIALGCLLFAGLATAADRGPWARGDALLLAVYGAVAAVLAVLWLVRERTRSRTRERIATALTVPCAVPAAVLGSVGFTVPALLLVVALVAFDVGVGAALGAAAAMTLPALAALLLAGHGWTVALINVVPVLVLLGFGVLLGAVLATYRDQNAQRDAALAESRAAAAELRRSAGVATELALAQERARSARELHDGLGHRLTVIRMALEFAERMRERDPGAAWHEVSAARAQSSEAIDEMRLWVRALTPVSGGAGSVVQALGSIADSFEGTGLAVQVTADSALDHPGGERGRERTLVLYRAAQEGLTNALRHAAARRVDITARCTATAVELTLVSDVGGAARSTVPPGSFAPGFGLRGLTERAAELGGTVRAYREGDCTHLEVALPLGETA